MPTKRKRILVSFTVEEKAEVRMKADQISLSISEFLRCLVLGYSMPNPVDYATADTILDLLKVNADQARLGNPLKLTLDEADGEFSPATIAHVEDLIRDIREVQEMTHNGVRTLHYILHPRRRRRGKGQRS